MSMDKAIQHGKEKRKPYTGSKAIDKSCRNHGGCQWCEENRKHKYKKQELKTEPCDGDCEHCDWATCPKEEAKDENNNRD